MTKPLDTTITQKIITQGEAIDLMYTMNKLRQNLGKLYYLFDFDNFIISYYFTYKLVPECERY